MYKGISRFAIKVDGTIYCDEDGRVKVFTTYSAAKEFIEAQKLQNAMIYAQV